MRAKGQAAMVAKIVVSVLMVLSAITISSNSLSSVLSSQTEQSEKAWLQENIRDPTQNICEGASSSFPPGDGFVKRDLEFDDIKVVRTSTNPRTGTGSDYQIRISVDGQNEHVLDITSVQCKIDLIDNTAGGLTKKFRVEQVGSGTENEAKITVKGSG